MLYNDIQCQIHAGKKVDRICLIKGSQLFINIQDCKSPVLCERCVMDHIIDHQSQTFFLKSFEKFQSVLDFFQCEYIQLINSLRQTVIIVDNFFKAAEQMEKQFKTLQRLFSALREKLNQQIDEQEKLCQFAIEKRTRIFEDQIKLMEGEYNQINQIIEENITYSEKQSEQYKKLSQQVYVYHKILPQQNQLKYKLQMINMDLSHSNGVTFYENNVDEVLAQFKHIMKNSGKIFYIDQFLEQPLIPLEKRTIQSLYSVKRQRYHDDWITSITSLHEKNKIATASSDTEIKIYDLNTCQVLKTLQGHTDSVLCLIFHWKTNQIISGSQDKTIKTWDVDSGQMIQNLIAHKGAVKAICNIVDEQQNIASVGTDKMLIIWDIDRRIPKLVSEFEAHEDVINSVISFIHEGKTYIASSGNDNLIKVWDYLRKKCLQVIQTQNTKSLLFQLGLLFSGGLTGQISIWELNTCSCLRLLNGHEASVNSIISLNNEDFIASASWDQQIIIWDYKSGINECNLYDPQQYCHQMIYLNDGETLVSASADMNLRIWKPNKEDQTITRLRTLENAQQYTIIENIEEVNNVQSCSRACRIF